MNNKYILYGFIAIIVLVGLYLLYSIFSTPDVPNIYDTDTNTNTDTFKENMVNESLNSNLLSK